MAKLTLEDLLGPQKPEQPEFPPAIPIVELDADVQPQPERQPEAEQIPVVDIEAGGTIGLTELRLDGVTYRFASNVSGLADGTDLDAELVLGPDGSGSRASYLLAQLRSMSPSGALRAGDSCPGDAGSSWLEALDAADERLAAQVEQNDNPATGSK